MKLARTALFSAVSLALAAGSAFAADKRDPGFNALDRNNDGWITRAEANGNPFLAKRFKQADRNDDGKLNRAEYLAVMTKKDLRLDRDEPASGGATAANKNRDPGFNALDRNNDGWVTRAEANGNPYLSKRFKAADKNNDGKLNRAEYLAVMAKKDVNTAKAKVDNRQPSASTGTTAPPQ